MCVDLLFFTLVGLFSNQLVSSIDKNTFHLLNNNKLQLQYKCVHVEPSGGSVYKITFVTSADLFRLRAGVCYSAASFMRTRMTL